MGVKVLLSRQRQRMQSSAGRLNDFAKRIQDIRFFPPAMFMLLLWSCILFLTLLTHEYGNGPVRSTSGVVKMLAGSHQESLDEDSKTSLEEFQQTRLKGAQSGLYQKASRQWCCRRSPSCIRPPFLIHGHRSSSQHAEFAVPLGLGSGLTDDVLNDGECACEVGWSGPSCNIPVCTPDCKHDGRCVRPNECRCTSEWTGATCAEQLCYPKCQHGHCAGHNKCVCIAGYQGPTCSIRCEHGLLHFASCECLPGWWGKSCDKALCTQTCVHGVCASPGKCACESGWTGHSCISLVSPQGRQGHLWSVTAAESTALTMRMTGGGVVDERNDERWGDREEAIDGEDRGESRGKEGAYMKTKQELLDLQSAVRKIKQKRAFEELEILQKEVARLNKHQAQLAEKEAKEREQREKESKDKEHKRSPDEGNREDEYKEMKNELLKTEADLSALLKQYRKKATEKASPSQTSLK
ncbi:hypothetical protein CYMTET_7099 [Cymbomonas tetramitiformis]|uniref:EGF-like domain-containing protein n=1 Tax=Cymbomonas tetramitiformis TaxID=36881 RepID=A0AAE0LHC3_9CHLO|nr:hypothetical protein CYMTET_7099 [Cymbomonas tetramitiformis]